MADDLHAVMNEPKAGADNDPGHEHEQPSRHARSEALGTEQQDERARPNRDRSPLSLAEVPDEMHDWLIVSPPPFFIPNSFGS
jgi:hypothetical protein